MAELKDNEREFLHHVEIYGLTPARAAKLTRVENPYAVLKRPEVAAAREALRRTAQQKLKVTREDVIQGLMEAIHDARLLADPMAQIRGWAEVRKTAGLDEPIKVDLTMREGSAKARKQIAAVPDSELLQLVDDGNVIDADFHEVRHVDAA